MDNAMQVCSWLQYIVCSCCHELDARLTVFVCFLASFSQSLLGTMIVPFPYILLPCLGIFFTLYFVFTTKDATRETAGHYLWFFLAQQVCSLWGLYYWFVTEYDVIRTCVSAFFLFTATVGALTSYRLGELLRGQQVFTSASV